MLQQIQQFWHAGVQESIAVRQDEQGNLFSQMEDIQDIFPDAFRFKIDGVNILFLQDPAGQRYNPKRIAHYPGKIVEVVTSQPSTASLPSPPSSSTSPTMSRSPQLFYSEDPSQTSLSTSSPSLSSVHFQPESQVHSPQAMPALAGPQAMPVLPGPQYQQHVEDAMAGLTFSTVPSPTAPPAPFQPATQYQSQQQHSQTSYSPQPTVNQPSEPHPVYQAQLPQQIYQPSVPQQVYQPSAPQPSVYQAPVPELVHPPSEPAPRPESPPPSYYPAAPSQATLAPARTPLPYSQGNMTPAFATASYTTRPPSVAAPSPQPIRANIPLPHQQYLHQQPPVQASLPSLPGSHYPAAAASPPPAVVPHQLRPAHAPLQSFPLDKGRVVQPHQAYTQAIGAGSSASPSSASMTLAATEQGGIVPFSHIQERTRLIHQRIKTVLSDKNPVQWHQCTVPRLFVLLPLNPTPNASPGTMTLEDFGVYFLCEHAGLAHIVPDSLGYKFRAAGKNDAEAGKRREQEFLERYGPYMLGVLKLVQELGEQRKATSIEIAVGFLQAWMMNQFNNSNNCNNSASKVSPEMISSQKLKGPVAEMFEDLGRPGGGFADFRRLTSYLQQPDLYPTLGNLHRTHVHTKTPTQGSMPGGTAQGAIRWMCDAHQLQMYFNGTYSQYYLSFLKTPVLQPNERGEHVKTLQKITLRVPSSGVVKALFLAMETIPNVTELEVMVDWKFTTAELKKLVDRLAPTHVRYLTLDLNDAQVEEPLETKKGKGKYFPLQDLFLNPKLLSLKLVGLGHLFPASGASTSVGPASSSSSSGFFGKKAAGSSTATTALPTSNLRVFHYLTEVHTEIDRVRMIGLLQSCPHLVEFCVGGSVISLMDNALSQAILNIKHLEVLHLYAFCSLEQEEIKNFIKKLSPQSGSTNRLRELVLMAGDMDNDEITQCVALHQHRLEVLLLDQLTVCSLSPPTILVGTAAHLPPSIIAASKTGNHLSAQFSDSYDLQTAYKSSPLSKGFQILATFALPHLTQLRMDLPHEGPNVQALQKILPHLRLTHLGLTFVRKISRSHEWAHTILEHVEWSALRSVFLTGFEAKDLEPLWKQYPADKDDAALAEGERGKEGICKTGQIQILGLDNMDGKEITTALVTQLHRISPSLKRLCLAWIDEDSHETAQGDFILSLVQPTTGLQFQQLEILTLMGCGAFTAKASTILQNRYKEFQPKLKIMLGYETGMGMGKVHRETETRVLGLVKAKPHRYVGFDVQNQCFAYMRHYWVGGWHRPLQQVYDGFAT